MALASNEHAAGGVFNTTHWSVVLTAGTLDSPEAFGALSHLSQTYWYPLYCCVRRYGYSPQDAQDLTQAFFAKLLENNQIALANPERGRFRTFLLRSLENFLKSQHRDATAQKRGGGRQLVSWDAQTAEDCYSSEPLSASPGALFEKQWAGAMLETVLATVSREFATNSRQELFQVLEPHLWGDDTSTPYALIAENLNMTVVAVRVTLHRLRQRFHDLLRAEIANTVENPADVDDELRYLRCILAS
jgi:RNA polymerase sigma factor (sigma-70 family)